jgi:hypothetical protein
MNRVPETDLPEKALVALLGMKLAVYSNSVTIIRAAQELFTAWDADHGLPSGAPELRIDLVIQPAADDVVSPSALVWRRHGATALAIYGASLLTVQYDRGYGLAIIPPALVAAEELCCDLLERLALELVSAWDRAPLRATLLVREGQALLLLGARGVGRSTLAEACMQAGFSVPADDAVYVSREGGVRFWGYVRQNSAPPQASRWHVLSAERALVCIVERSAGRASRLEQLDVVTAQTLLHGTGADMIGDALTAQGAYRLMMGSDPRNAVALLGHLVQESGVRSQESE